MEELLRKIDETKRKSDVLASAYADSSDFVRSIRNFYRVATAWSSNALEGGTLTETETRIVIEDGITVGGKPVRDILDAIGHARSYDFLWKCADARRFLTTDDILAIHRLFYGPTSPSDAGKLRTVSVFISGSEYVPPPPELLPERMAELGRWLSGNARRIHPVRCAALLHLAIAEIHPFVDGNGRTARLAMNLVLVKNGYRPASVPPLLRNEYLTALERAHPGPNGNRKKDGVLGFERFVGERVLGTERDYLRFMEGERQTEERPPWMDEPGP